MLLSAPGEKPSGFMIPIPQYPLYSATVSEYSAEKVSGDILIEHDILKMNPIM